MKLKTVFTTPISFYVQETTYVPGQGITTSWRKFESILSDQSKMSVFFCEWVGTYGSMKLSAQAQGINDSARVRMPFIPDLCKKLKSQLVIIAKDAANILVDGNPDQANINSYRVWGGVNIINEENQYMEFNVQRYEVQ